jgi:hypothetical protein
MTNKELASEAVSDPMDPMCAGDLFDEVDARWDIVLNDVVEIESGRLVWWNRGFISTVTHDKDIKALLVKVPNQ